MNTISQTALIVGITESVLGGPGKIILGVIVALACLTTAIGLTSATGNYFSKLTNGKLKYEVIVTIVSVFSAIVSNFGVNAIIKISAPILKNKQKMNARIYDFPTSAIMNSGKRINYYDFILNEKNITAFNQ